MKARGFVVKFTFSALVLLAGSLLLLAGYRIARNSFHQSASARSVALPQSAVSAVSAGADKSKWTQAYGKLPLSFIENQGQGAQPVRYVSHGSQYDLFLTPQEAVLALTHSTHLDLSPRHRRATLLALMKARRAAASTTTTTALRLQFEGANPDPQIAGGEKLPGLVNYYIGNDPAKWHTRIPTYAQVKYSQVYPGVDLVFYGNQRKLEYDFVVAPGADPSVIRMYLAGAKKLRLDAHGNVLLTVADGEIQLQKPLIYQNINGRRREIAGAYSLRGEHVSFAVANYDRRQSLIVDPVLNYSTYLGGSSTGDQGISIAVDSSGDAFVAGQTFSATFPTKNGLSITGNANGLGFVSELNPSGTALLNSTYLGGTTSDGDGAFGLALDSTGNIYVTGFTSATDFPTTDGTGGTVAALKQSLTANASGTSFLTKLSPTFTLLYSTYLGGTNDDFGNAVAADSAGNAYVTGFTDSGPGTGSGTPSDNLLFPILNGYQTTLTDPNGAAFLTKIDTTIGGESSLIYSTYLEGTGANFATAGFFFGDEGFGVVVDATNHAYVAGTTSSTDFLSPLPAATKTFQTTVNASNLWGTGFVTEIDTTQSGNSSLLYATYLGGSGNPNLPLGDNAEAIDLQTGTSVVYVTGTTASSAATFPLLNEYSNVADGANGAGFVTLLDTSVTGASSLQYSTFFGPGGSDGFGIKADSAGNAYVTGATASPAFPLTSGAFQTALASGASGEGFITELNTTGSVCGTPPVFPCVAELLYSTYFGGSGAGPFPDEAAALALGSTTPPTVYVTGQTFSSNLPVFPGAGAATPAFQTSLIGSEDAFIASLTLEPTLVVSPISLSFTATAIGTPTAAQTVTLTNNTNAAIPFASATITNASPAGTDFAVSATTCGPTIPTAGCTISVTFDPSTTSESATLTIVDGDSTSPQSVALTGTAPALFNVSPTSLTFTASAVNTATAAQTLTITNGRATAVTYTSATVTSTGGFAGDFTLPTNTCATTPTIAAGTTCTIGVVYTPTTAGTETATLTIVDTDTTSPQTVTLTGNTTPVTPGFTLAASPTTLTVAKGSSGTATITVTSVGTFNAAVTLACTGAPNRSTCVISPSSVTPTAGGTTTATLTFATTALVTPPPSAPVLPPGSIKVVAPIALVLMLIILLASEQRLRTRLAMAGALLVFVALSGCGGSGGTPQGTDTLTITGTSSGATSQTATISVTVGPK
jgi:hypothetical protein